MRLLRFAITMSKQLDEEADEPIYIGVIFFETIRVLLNVTTVLTLWPLLCICVAAPFRDDVAALFQHSLYRAWWEGILCAPYSLLFFIPIVGVQLSERNRIFLCCFWWVAIPWWCMYWMLSNHAGLVFSLAIVIPSLPPVLAWLYKFAFFAGNWARNGNPHWNHTFVCTYDDSYYAASERLGLTPFIRSDTVYNSTGIQLDFSHWEMGVALLLQYCAFTLFLLTFAWPIYWSGNFVLKRSRARMARLRRKND